MPVPEFRPEVFRIERGGQSWSADWQLTPEGKVCVRSAYGSRTLQAGRAKPENVARRALAELVDDWRARQRGG